MSSSAIAVVILDEMINQQWLTFGVLDPRGHLNGIWIDTKNLRWAMLSDTSIFGKWVTNGYDNWSAFISFRCCSIEKKGFRLRVHIAIGINIVLTIAV